MPAINGTSGSDSIGGTTGDDVITALAGNDTVFASSGNDTVYGGIGDDNLQGQAGNDALYGEDGNDILTGGPGSDLLDGGAGNDTLVVINDQFAGSDFSAGDQYVGGEGSDTIRFRGDFTYGFAGFYIASASISGIEHIRADLPVNLTLAQLTGFATATGIFNVSGTGTLDLTGNRFLGGSIQLGSGNDTVTMSGNTPTTHASISGGGGNDHLIGSETGDSLAGDAGADWLEGHGGNDNLHGGTSDDRIDGGEGDDTLYGDSGADTFVFGGGGNDTIADFMLGWDRIDLSAYGLTTFGEILARAKQVGDNVVIDLSPGDSITLYGIRLSMLEAGDFVGVSNEGAPPPPFSIIPELPAAPTVAPITEMVTVVTDSYEPYTVGHDEVVYSTTLFALFGSEGVGYMSPLTNDGTVWNYWNYEVEDATVAAIGVPNHIRGAENNGLMVLHLGRATTVNAIAFWESTADNHGQVYVINEGLGNAWFVTTFLTDRSVNSGLVAVQARNGLAIGYEFHNAGSLDNQVGGEILVEGMQAIAFYCRFGGLAGDPVQVTNSGTIIVHALDLGQASMGLYLAGGSTQQYLITNSGLLAADIAVYGSDDSFTVTGDVVQVIHNLSGGEIHGLIYLQRGNDILVNAGTIYGAVDMGAGDDTVDTASGFISGIVDLGNGDDQYVGSAYADYVEGGAGNDSINGGAGFDYASYELATGAVVVDLSLIGPQDTGGAGTDTLQKIEGLIGSAFADVLSGNSVANDLFGLAGNDVLYGRGGNDTLDGGTGTDVMRGGLGNDTYYVDSGSDLAVENAGEGTDLVYSSVSYRLRENVENLTLTGTAVRAYGNSTANRLIGNNGANVLDGLGGADIMRGGLGNDRYYVDNAGDRVVELSGQGIDAVISSISFKLTGNVENLTITGTAVRATGNTLANVLVGNDGNNILNGGFGNDVMRGGGGNDTYFVFDSGDVVVEASGEGRDRVDSTVSYTLSANVEDLFLRGSSAINGTGNALDNLISGNSGNNILDGRGGADDLRGGNGADTFVFRDGEFGGTTSSTADRIIDFSHDQNDHIDLSAVDANTLLGGDQAFDFIGTAGFHGVAGELRYQQLGGNTYVYGDTDGDGTADFMIRVDGLHSLELGDFVI